MPLSGPSGSGTSYIDGEVQYYTDLPITVGDPPVNSAYLVREASGIWFVSRKPAGIYIRLANSGALTDWSYAGTFPDVFSDAHFTIYNEADSSKELGVDLSGAATGKKVTLAGSQTDNRTLTLPDVTSTLATLATPLDDFAAPSDNTDLNASTSAHGLALKVTAPAAGMRNVHCVDNGETSRKDAAMFVAGNPANLGTASAGVALTAARSDHVHNLPAISEITGLGTGVATALATNIGSAGAPVVNGGELGTPSSGSAANLTSFPTLNQNTTGSAASLSVSGQTGLVTVTGITSTNRVKTVRDAADTLLELGGSYTPTGTWTSMTLVTPALGTPASGVLTNCSGTAKNLTAGGNPVLFMSNFGIF